jgi:DNA-binding NarL/FixJ family response regulator
VSIANGAVTPVVPARPIRLVVVDDHEIVARGVVGLARERPRIIEVVLTVRTSDDLFERLGGVTADVVLLDLHLDDGSAAADTVRRLDELGLRCLIYTSEMRPVPIRQVFSAGARGVCLKSDPDDSLLEALTEVMTGQIAMSSELAFLLATSSELAAHLAPREQEALELLASGVPKKAIGNQMHPKVAAATVSTYFTRVASRYAELGRPTGNSFDVVREAHRDGHLDL